MQFSFPVLCSKSFGTEQASLSRCEKYSSVSEGVRWILVMRFEYSSFVNCSFLKQ